MVVLLAVVTMDAWCQQHGLLYEIPAWVIAMCSATVSSVIWWRFRRQQDDATPPKPTRKPRRKPDD